ncbi:AMP-binding protein [Bradymonas sediminis]|uniref:Uncharacterized protein n=1 Tax=Bradymonas sediminis TaxID=1548548 RepID=A0A2Z4FJJ1_9DELT|nr:AMP-binding protein [Bradymonas sediminis]AWV88866.1 hypothetical protein DN745_05735 [Bradymonas sediminis]TDP71868.1 phenylacetate-CoA ligase [Bradymonas sediminis]
MLPGFEAFQSLNPLITRDGYALLERLYTHPCAPRWNEVIGDRFVTEDLAAVAAFRRRLQQWPGATAGQPAYASAPPPSILEWVQQMRQRSPIFRAHILEGFPLARDWAYLPTMSRRDIAERPVDITPMDADLKRLIVYDTTGTTGHAVIVPHHPRTLAFSQALGEYAMGRYGVQPVFGAGRVGCFNIGAQVNTYVFAAIFSVWEQSGFAKINLHPKDWSDGATYEFGESVERARAYVEAFSPEFITSDPVGIAEMLRWEVGHGAKAIFSTAVELSAGLKAQAEARFGCPVIDWYSMTETGPIAFSAPDGDGLEIISPDIFVEAIDEDGFPVGPDKIGELTVTGGRNPYLPLLRYRTGDFGRVANGRIHDLHARKLVFFRAADGALVNPVDIGRIMRLHCAFAQHQFVQQANGACRVRVRPVPGVAVDREGLRRELATLFGEEVDIEVIVDEQLGDGQPGGKVEPYMQHGEI